MKQSPKTEDYESEDEIEQESYLSRLENLSMCLKQINRLITTVISDDQRSNKKRVAYELMNTVKKLDRNVEEYNIEHFRTKMKSLIYFKIEILAINREEPYFTEIIEIRERSPGEQGYFASMVFSRASTEKFYRMHVELWKYDGQTVTTNAVLSRYEKNCMNDMLDSLTDRGFVAYIDGTAVALKTKRVVYRGFGKSGDPGNLMQILKSYVENYLKQLYAILTKQKSCFYCGRHMIYESEYCQMMPPTVTLSLSKYKSQEQNQKQIKEQKQRVFHEACSMIYFKSPPFPSDFLGNIAQGRSEKPKMPEQGNSKS